MAAHPGPTPPAWGEGALLKHSPPGAVLAEAARRFGAREGELQPLSGGHCSGVWRFDGAAGGGVLRVVAESEELDERAARAILAWVEFAAAGSAGVAAPLRSTGGAALELIAHDGLRWLASAQELAPGVRGELLPGERWDARLHGALGRTTGRLHALARSYAPADPELERPSWDRTGNCFNPDGDLRESHPAIADRRDEVLARLEVLPRGSADYGVIHADLHAANFTVEPEAARITVFDFDDCCRGWFAMDIALFLFDFAVLWPDLGGPSARGRLTSYWRGYRGEHELDEAWLDELPLFLKLLEIGVFADVHALGPSAGPDSWAGRFLAGRRERLERDEPYLGGDPAAWFGVR